jgi:hypothetical protein
MADRSHSPDRLHPTPPTMRAAPGPASRHRPSPRARGRPHRPATLEPHPEADALLGPYETRYDVQRGYGFERSILVIRD